MVYTQRLKLSGMRWSRVGAQVILNLRLRQLTGVWAAAYQQAFDTSDEPTITGQSFPNARAARNAA